MAVASPSVKLSATKKVSVCQPPAVQDSMVTVASDL